MFSQKQFSHKQLPYYINSNDNSERKDYLLSQVTGILPKVPNPVSLRLYGSFDESYAAVIPNTLGRISYFPSHKEEYTSLLSQRRSSIKIKNQTEIVRPGTASRRNLYTHKKISVNSPGVVRIMPLSSHMNFSSSTHMLLNPSMKRQTSYIRIPQPQEEISKEVKHHTGEALSKLGPVAFINNDKYKGDWSSNHRHGTGSYYYKSIGLKYKGDWHKDIRSGQGSLKFRNGDTLRGLWENDQLTNTRGVFTYTSGEVYEGEVQNGMKHGRGDMKYKSAVFSGIYVKDQREGLGAIRSPSFYFEGTFSNDSTDGPGIMIHRAAIKIEKDENASKRLDSALQDLLNTHGLNKHTTQFKFTDGDIIYSSLSAASLLKKVNAPEEDIKDGRFLGGKLNGSGIAQYGKFGRYIGQFKDGKKHGWGFFQYRDLKNECLWIQETNGEYRGQWANDLRHGFGRMTWDNGVVYEGGYKKDKRNQVQGKMWFSTGEIYEGGWSNNFMEGYGELRMPIDITFKGQFHRGKPSKVGIIEFNDGSVYNGEIASYEPHGPGKMVMKNGDVYRGNFLKGHFAGQGVMEFANGDHYEGNWDNGMRSREGKMRYAEEEYIYEGKWKENMRNGWGRLSDFDGNIIYEGFWISDKENS